jgi:phosphate starvation-inducible PhoH-like protein
MDEFDFLSGFMSDRQIKKLNKQSKKEKSIIQSKSLRGSQQIAQDNVATFNIKELNAKNPNQQLLIDSLQQFNQIICFGPAGTGKTYVQTAFAARLFLQRKIDKIVITRPNVATGKTLGLFPGDVTEKMMVWCQPVVQVLKEYLGESLFELALKRGQIELQPLETIRGRNFDRSFIIIDECQNLNIEEVKALTTRVGKNSKICFNGDLKQTDIKEYSGLKFLLEAIHNDLDLQSYSAVVEFDIDDIVRSDLCKAWIKYFYNNNL